MKIFLVNFSFIHQSMIPCDFQFVEGDSDSCYEKIDLKKLTTISTTVPTTLKPIDSFECDDKDAEDDDKTLT
jgi:hypothetical protein